MLTRAPLVPVALALAGGIAAGRFGPLPTGFWAACGLASLAAAVVTFRRRHLHLLTCACVGATVLSIGAVYVRMLHFSVPGDHVIHCVGHSRRLATIRGQVVTWPQIYGDEPPPETFGYRRPPRTSMLLAAEAIHVQSESRWQPVSGLVRLTVQQPDHRLAAGQRLELVGWMGRIRGPDNPGQFDWQVAARNSGTRVSMSVEGVDGVKILAPPAAGALGRAAWRLRAAARQHLLDCGDVQGGRLVNALVLGERHPALRGLSRAMVRGGVAHFLSISGLHLGVFLGFVYFLCRMAAMTPRRSAALVLVILIAYVLLAEPRAPLWRSAVMAAALCLATISRRRHAALNALAAAAVILLAADPLQLFSAGFQLSFVIVAGLLLGHHPVRRLLFGRWIRRRGLMVFRGRGSVRRWVYHTAADKLMSGVAMCLTAYVAAAPLVAAHFGLFSPYAPVLSVLLFPLVLAILVPGYVSMALAWPMPNLSHAVGQLAGQAAAAMERTVDAASRLPGLSFELRPVGPGWTLLCYGAIILVLAARRLRWGRILAAGAVLAAAGATWQTQRAAPAPARAELHLLAVGNGQCAVLRTPGGKTFLIDAGTRTGFDAHSQVLEPFLRHQRLPHPTAAFISHANTDHYNALPGVLAKERLERVYLNDYFATGPEPAEPAAALMALLAERHVPVVRLRAGASVQLDDRTHVEVLWPPADKPAGLTVNDTSLVLRVSCDGKSVLIAGDIDAIGQRALLEATRTAPGGIRADVLTLPHHGSWETTLPALFDAIAPETVLVSSGRDPLGPAAGDNKARRFYRRIKAPGRYFSTARNGWVRLSFGRGKVLVQTMRSEESPTGNAR